MKRKSSANLFLLGYLVLLLNLGPAWHRAPIFGIHDHGTVGHDAGVCSCGHNHAGESASRESTADEAGSIDLPSCDCAVCKFFKQYNVTFHGSTVDGLKLVVHQAAHHRKIDASQPLLLHRARGPPVAWTSLFVFASSRV